MSRETVPIAALCSLLASALGEARAEKEVRSKILKLRINAKNMTPTQAVAVLQAIGEEPGLVGIVARFAASRMILLWRVHS